MKSTFAFNFYSALEVKSNRATSELFEGFYLLNRTKLLVGVSAIWTKLLEAKIEKQSHFLHHL